MKHQFLYLSVFCSITAIVIVNCGNSGSGRKMTFVTIGTGAVTGVYYPAGGAISRMVNKKSDEYSIKATVESTAGSVYNVNAVLAGDLDFGVVQSDRQYQAYNGLAEWEKSGSRTELRSIFSIHPEAVTLVASEKSGIRSVTELRGKRVNLGNPGSGPLQNSRDALSAFGLTEKDIIAEYIKAVEAPGLLKDERIDAFFYTVGHPSGNIKEATSGRVAVSLIPIAGAGIDSLIGKYPYYALATIPIALYPNAKNTNEIRSFGVKGTFVASSKAPDNIVYAITKEVFENLAEFKKLHPAFSVLTRENMLEGLSAPLHPGAVKYYKEADLIKHINPQLVQE